MKALLFYLRHRKPDFPVVCLRIQSENTPALLLIDGIILKQAKSSEL